MRQISCIIFDLDGTLTRTNQLIFDTFNHVTEKYIGKTFTPDEITKMFGPPEDVAIERLVGNGKKGEAMDDFYSYYEKHHPRLAKTYAGIEEILSFLKSKRIILAIFTGKGRQSTLISLDLLKIRKYFDLIITGSDVENHKPSGEGINKIMNRYSLKQSQVLMVGDAVADVRAAREAGVRMAAVLWDSYGKDKVLELELDFKFHTTEEFFTWLKTSLN